MCVCACVRACTCVWIRSYVRACVLNFQSSKVHGRLISDITAVHHVMPHAG